MAADRFRQRIRWVALHGVIRGLSKFAMRRSGDPQARLIADPPQGEPLRAGKSQFAHPAVEGRALQAGRFHQQEREIAPF